MTYERLIERMKIMHKTKCHCAAVIGISPQLLNKRLHHSSPFKVREIHILCDELEIPYDEVFEYFE